MKYFINFQEQNNILSNINNKIIPQLPNMNINQNLNLKHYEENNLEIKEPNSCIKCEEIYRYIIINKLPLKKITCLYCNKEMNEKTFKYFINLINKEEEELNNKEHYENNNERNKIPIIDKKDKIKEKEDKKEDENKKKFKSRIKRNSKKEVKNNLENSKTQKDKNQEEKSNPINNINNSINNNNNILISNNTKIINNTIHQTLNIKSRNSKSQNDLTEKTLKSETLESENKIKHNNVLEYSNSYNKRLNDNLSLAEAFRSRRKKLKEEIEKRVKSEKNILRQNSENIIEMNHIYEHMNKTKGRFSKSYLLSKSLSLNNKSFSGLKKNNKIPCDETMKRLINGEKVKMSNKEMKNLNKRLFEKYNNIITINKKKEEKKKDEIKKLNLSKKEFTDKLKNKVVNNYRKKSTSPNMKNEKKKIKIETNQKN